MNIPFVDLKNQYQGIKQEVLAEIAQALDGMQLFLGKNVQTLEADFADYCGTEFAIAPSMRMNRVRASRTTCSTYNR